VFHTHKGAFEGERCHQHKERSLMPPFSQIVSSRIGAFVVLALAAYLEVQGDVCRSLEFTFAH
jgi:hypothetical protein